jgi:hypothetical protein
MKYFFLIFALLNSTIALCQIQITGTIVDNETEKPIPGLYFYVHKNYDKWINIDKTDEQGQFEVQFKTTRCHLQAEIRASV